MRLKPKRRIILLVAAALVLGAAVFSAVFVRSWQRGRITDQYLRDGLASYKNGEYFAAMGHLSKYIQRTQSDRARAASAEHAEALLGYAESRRQVPEADGHNFKDCITFYQQYLDARPDDHPTAMTLLNTYNLCGFGAEAVKLAQKLHPPLDQTTKADIPALRAEAMGQILAKNYGEVDPIVARILTFEPLDVQAHICRARAYALARNGSAAAGKDLREFADNLRQQHPGDPAAALISAYSYELVRQDNDVLNLRGLLATAAGLDANTGARVKAVDYPDAEYATRLVECCDMAPAFDLSLAVLRDAAPKFNDPLLTGALARRLWQDGAFDELEQRFGSIDPASRDADPDVLAFRVLALQHRGKKDLAAPIETAIAGREGDYRRLAWARAIPLLDPARAPKPAEAIQPWKDALKYSPYEPVCLAGLAEVYAAVGRNEDARAMWSDAFKYPAGMSWLVPPLRTAQTFLSEGRADDAAKWANVARAVAPSRIDALAVWSEAQAAVVQRGGTPDRPAASLLRELEQVLDLMAKSGQSPEAIRPYQDRLLVPHVILLVHTNQRDQAKAVALAALAATPPPANETLQRLAAASATEKLGIEAQCVQAMSGAATSTAAYVRAAELADVGKTDQAIKSLADAAAANPTDPGAQTSLPRLFERLNRTSEAQAAWTKIGDANPESLQIQRACLQSTTVPGNTEFLEKTIQRYLKLIGAEAGSQDDTVTIARARALMWGSPSRADRDKAVAMLGELAAREPSAVEPKVLLASALAYSRPGQVTPDLPRAATYLRDAAALEPRSASIALQLAGIYQTQGDFPRAREQLLRVASDQAADSPARRTAAEMLIAQGDAASAVGTLSELVAAAGDRVPGRMLAMLADAYLALRQDDKAAPLYDRLAAGAADDPDTIYVTARHFLLAGDQQRAAAVLARLDAASPEPGVKQAILARLAMDRSDFKAAQEQYEAALAAAPKRADFWRQYAAMLVQQAQFQTAAEVVKRGLAANPADPSLTVVAEQIGILQSGDANADLRALAASLGASAVAPEALEALKSVSAAADRGADTTEQLGALADRFPGVSIIQVFAARRIAPRDPGRAAILLQRALSLSPTDPAPAKAAAEIYLTAGRYPDMLAAAQAWRQRDRTRGIEPDMAIANAYLRLGKYAEGVDLLKPYVQAAAERPDEGFGADILNLYAHLLISAGQEPRARELLSPLLPRWRSVRGPVWLGITIDGSLQSFDQVKAWLDAYQAAIPADTPDERIALAQAYFAAAANPRCAEHKSELEQQSLKMLSDLTRDPKTATARTFEALGIVRQSTGDNTGAEEAYRKAIELDPTTAIALNNLAYMLVQSGSGLDAALDLANRAVKTGESDGNLDTLAFAYKALAAACSAKGDAQGAARNFGLAADAQRRRAHWVPSDPSPVGEAAKMYDAAGNWEAAAGMYDAYLTFGSLQPIQAAGAKNNLAMALLRLDRAQADADRAFLLASEAVRTAPNSAFLDTRGWAEIRLARYTQAAQTFDQAIKAYATEQHKPDDSDPTRSFRLGRATALAHLGADERKEAQQLLDGLESQMKSAEEQARFRKAREALASR